MVCLVFVQNSFFNNPEVIELPCGASHGVGSTAGMAKLHGILANGGSTVDGRRLLSENTIQMLQSPLNTGPEKTFGVDLFYSCGMELLPILEKENVQILFFQDSRTLYHLSKRNGHIVRN